MTIRPRFGSSSRRRAASIPRSKIRDRRRFACGAPHRSSRATPRFHAHGAIVHRKGAHDELPRDFGTQLSHTHGP
jgi:hypothetical protein